MGILWGYPQDFLWVWDGYGDRNSVPPHGSPVKYNMTATATNDDQSELRVWLKHRIIIIIIIINRFV